MTRIANTATPEYIAARKVFSNHGGSLTGGTSPFAGAGRLPMERRNGFNQATDADDFYAVYSYATPIAWYAHGTWVIPEVKYSVTTSRHQAQVRRAVAV
jgi:hypothetical protein